MKFVSIAFTFSLIEKNECVTRFDNGWILSTIGFGYFHERLINAALNATNEKSGIQGLMFFDKCNVAFLSVDQQNAEATENHLQDRAVNFVRYGIIAQ